MNLGELRTAVEQRTGVDYDDAALNGVINEAVDAISNAGDWPWLRATPDEFDTVVGTSLYALPVDFGRSDAMLVNGVEYYPISIRDIDADPSVRGFAIVDGNQLQISPEPARVFAVKHRYFRAEPDLSADGDTPLLPARYHGALVNYACAIVLDRVGQVSRAERYQERYETWLKDTKKGARRFTGPLRIRVRPGGGW